MRRKIRPLNATIIGFFSWGQRVLGGIVWVVKSEDAQEPTGFVANKLNATKTNRWQTTPPRRNTKTDHPYFTHSVLFFWVPQLILVLIPIIMDILEYILSMFKPRICPQQKFQAYSISMSQLFHEVFVMVRIQYRLAITKHYITMQILQFRSMSFIFSHAKSAKSVTLIY